MGNVLNMSPSAEFDFLSLPFEIRKHVYISMLEEQVVHCCSDEKQVHHTRAESEDNPEEHFFDELMSCSIESYESLWSEVRWTHKALSKDNSPSPSDVLNFLLSCKTVWNEMEPLLWKHTTFCIGLPQFAGFYKRFLVQDRSNHPVKTPRAQLLQRVSVAFVHVYTLASSIGRSGKYDYFNHHDLVASAANHSIGYLTKQCTGLQDLVALVEGVALRDTPGPGGALLDPEDSNTFIRFKALQNFKLKVSGRVDAGVADQSLPSTNQAKLALDATNSILANILTRTEEPPRDIPPEGISPTDPDYTLLRHYEKHYEGDPRLTELVLRTRLYLEKLGVAVPPLADAGNP